MLTYLGGLGILARVLEQNYYRYIAKFFTEDLTNLRLLLDKVLIDCDIEADSDYIYTSASELESLIERALGVD